MRCKPLVLNTQVLEPTLSASQLWQLSRNVDSLVKFDHMPSDACDWLHVLASISRLMQHCTEGVPCARTHLVAILVQCAMEFHHAVQALGLQGVVYLGMSMLRLPGAEACSLNPES